MHHCEEYHLRSSLEDLKSKNKILIETFSEQNEIETFSEQKEIGIYSAEKNRLFMEEILREFDKSNIGGKSEKEDNEEMSNEKNRLILHIKTFLPF